MGNCCKPRNQQKDGTGLRKFGEKDPAFQYYKNQKTKMMNVNLNPHECSHGKDMKTPLEKSSTFAILKKSVSQLFKQTTPNYFVDDKKRSLQQMQVYNRPEKGKNELVLQVNGQIAFFIREMKFRKQEHMISKLIRRGYLKENDGRFTKQKHDFGKMKKAHHDDDTSSCDSCTSYDTDEVHDTRSYIVGYYRKPKQDNAEEELKLFYQTLKDKPEQLQKQLETNVSRFPDHVRSVKTVSIGTEHLIATVVEAGTNEQSLYGLGSNIWGQLGRDPFRHPFLPHLMPVNLRSLSNKGNKNKSYIIQQAECGSHHSVFLIKQKVIIPGSSLFAKSVTETQKIIQIGNDNAEASDEFLLSSENRRKNKLRLAQQRDLPIIAQIQRCFKGKFVNIPSGDNLPQGQDFITIIKAAYNRSIAVTAYGHVYVWGRSFKNQRLDKPQFLFQDKNGIEEIRLGLSHGVYQQTANKNLYSWGDHTIGQTGNNYAEVSDSFLMDEVPSHLDWQGQGKEPEHLQTQSMFSGKNRRFKYSAPLRKALTAYEKQEKQNKRRINATRQNKLFKGNSANFSSEMPMKAQTMNLEMQSGGPALGLKPNVPDLPKEELSERNLDKGIPSHNQDTNAHSLNLDDESNRSTCQIYKQNNTQVKFQKQLLKFFDGILPMEIKFCKHELRKFEMAAQIEEGTKEDDIQIQEGKVVQFECGMNHNIALTDTGLIYVWGDNRYGQIKTDSRSDQKFVYRNPQIATEMTKMFRKQAFSVETGNYTTGLAADLGHNKRDFHVWGGQTMIERIGAQTMIKAQETRHGTGAMGKGGSADAEGITLIDTQTDDSKPHMLYMAQDNIVSLQERPQHHHQH